jgi:hypothetical protein
MIINVNLLEAVSVFDRWMLSVLIDVADNRVDIRRDNVLYIEQTVENCNEWCWDRVPSLTLLSEDQLTLIWREASLSSSTLRLVGQHLREDQTFKLVSRQSVYQAIFPISETIVNAFIHSRTHSTNFLLSLFAFSLVRSLSLSLSLVFSSLSCIHRASVYLFSQPPTYRRARESNKRKRNNRSIIANQHNEYLLSDVRE